MRAVEMFTSKLVASVMSLLLVLNPLLVGSANAQTLDLEAPEIEHFEMDTGIAGETQTFSFVVTDNNSVEQVIFYSRSDSSAEFIPQFLERGEKDTYTASVKTAPNMEVVIEYYFEATDVGGTSAFVGQEWDPRKRMIGIPKTLETVADKSEAGTSPKPKSRTWLYVAGGVIALGLLAGLSSGGGGDDDTAVFGPNSGSDCDAEEGTGQSCTIIFTVSPP